MALKLKLFNKLMLGDVKVANDDFLCDVCTMMRPDIYTQTENDS